MKVILINSPIYNKKVADSEDYLPPLGLGYIATSLKENGIDVKIVDAVNSNLTVEEIVELISKDAPDFVGTNIFSINYELVKQIKLKAISYKLKAYFCFTIQLSL